ncbi:MAG: diphosphate--fructose-6-phosphate 1-phosphotransferase [Treponema sp.]
MKESLLQTLRRGYKPKLPNVLLEDNISIKKNPAKVVDDIVKSSFPKTAEQPFIKLEKSKEKIEHSFKKIGVILSGGQAAGGHNVISGLFDAMKKANASSHLYGFKGGPSGLIENKYIEITESLLEQYRNTGGFDIIGSGRTKIQTEEQINSSIETARNLDLDGLLIVGGDDSNTNAAFLAESFLNAGLKTSVIGVPKTIDGDLKNEYIETSFGFDTATKTYSELIGNIARDATSAKKYWHFIKLMGRSASHIALECALQTAPNICLISEEVAHKKMTLEAIAKEIAEVILARSKNGEDFGLILVPEGLIEFIPEMQTLISELNEVLGNNPFSDKTTQEEKEAILSKKLSEASLVLFKSLPKDVAQQLLLDRDPHGNVQVSRIETEKLLIYFVEKELAILKKEGKYNGKFSSYSHFFGYEGRSAFPSNFDCNYCYTLGYTAFILIEEKCTGYIVSVKDLTKPVAEWSVGAVPLVSMLNVERRSGKDKLVIKKALVDLSGKPFMMWQEMQKQCRLQTSYLYPGAIQYFGIEALVDATTITLANN